IARERGAIPCAGRAGSRCLLRARREQQVRRRQSHGLRDPWLLPPGTAGDARGRRGARDRPGGCRGGTFPGRVGPGLHGADALSAQGWHVFSGGSPPEPVRDPGTAALPRSRTRPHRAPDPRAGNRAVELAVRNPERGQPGHRGRQDARGSVPGNLPDHRRARKVHQGCLGGLARPRDARNRADPSAGDQKGYLDGIKVYADERPEGRGPVGVCFRTGKPCIIHDYVGEPRAKPWRERAIAHGLRSAAVLPLRLRGEVRGVFIVYAGVKDVFQDREVGLLEEIADSVSFAMDHLDHEEKRRRAEESLRHREAQYRAVIETSSDGFWMANEEGRILEVNDAYVRRSGYGREELVGIPIFDLQAIEQPEETGLTSSRSDR